MLTMSFKTHTEQIVYLKLFSEGLQSKLFKAGMVGSFSEDFRLLDLKCKQFANGQILEADNISRE